MKTTKKKLRFTIQAEIEISISDVYRLREIEEAIETLQAIGSAEITDVRVIESED